MSLLALPSRFYAALPTLQTAVSFTKTELGRIKDFALNLLRNLWNWLMGRAKTAPVRENIPPVEPHIVFIEQWRAQQSEINTFRAQMNAYQIELGAIGGENFRSSEEPLNLAQIRAQQMANEQKARELQQSKRELRERIQQSYDQEILAELDKQIAGCSDTPEGQKLRKTIESTKRAMISMHRSTAKSNDELAKALGI